MVHATKYVQAKNYSKILNNIIHSSIYLNESHIYGVKISDYRIPKLREARVERKYNDEKDEEINSSWLNIK